MSYVDLTTFAFPHESSTALNLLESPSFWFFALFLVGVDSVCNYLGGTYLGFVSITPPTCKILPLTLGTGLWGYRRSSGYMCRRISEICIIVEIQKIHGDSSERWLGVYNDAGIIHHASLAAFECPTTVFVWTVGLFHSDFFSRKEVPLPGFTTSPLPLYWMPAPLEGLAGSPGAKCGVQKCRLLDPGSSCGRTHGRRACNSSSFLGLNTHVVHFLLENLTAL